MNAASLEQTNDARERMALRAAEVARRVGLSKRTIDRLIAAGSFPKPDKRINRISLWATETVERWIRDEPPSAVRPGLRRNQQTA